MKNIEMKEETSFVKELLLSEFPGTEGLSLGDYFDERASKETHEQLEKEREKRKIDSPQEAGSYFKEVLKQNKLGDKERFEEILKIVEEIEEGVSEKISFKLFKNGIKKGRGDLSEEEAKKLSSEYLNPASQEYEKRRKGSVSPEDIYKLMYNELSARKTGDYHRCLW